MLLVQEYLKEHTIGDLAKDHGVYASFSKSGHKFSLNYDQIEARESDPLAQECRGLILALADGRPLYEEVLSDGKKTRDNMIPGETTVLAFPMRRFFNHGQGAAAEINWKDPKLSILEKMDGTLCIVYYDSFTGQWCVATRSVPEADLIMDNGRFTFRTLFEKALKDTCSLDFIEFTRGLNTRITYCFELTTPYNRIVVNYPESRVTLLAARQLYNNYQEIELIHLGGGMRWVDFDLLDQKSRDHLISLGHSKEDTPAAFVPVPFNLKGVPVVRAYTFTSIEDIHNYVSNQNPLEHEGVVVLDSNFNRIKVKNAAYVAFNRAREVLGASDRNCLELVLAEKEDDVMPALPKEIQDNLLKIKEGYRTWLREQEELYKDVFEAARAVAPDKKTFAYTLNARKVKFPGVHFAIFDGKASSVKDFIMKNRKDGTWANSLLDKILESITPKDYSVVVAPNHFIDK